MRAVVFAYSDVGYVCLDLLLAQGAEVDRGLHSRRRPERAHLVPLRRASSPSSTDLPVFAPERLDADDWLARLRAADPDFLFSFYYRRMLPTAVLETARRGALNLHGSLLPQVPRPLSGQLGARSTASRRPV